MLSNGVLFVNRMFTPQGEEPLIDNFSDSAADIDLPPDTVTPVLTAADMPRCISSVPLNSSSAACQSQMQPHLAFSDASEPALSRRHSTSPTTSQSDVDFSSPDTADYAKAADNVSDTSDTHHRCCGSSVQPSTDIVDTQPDDLVRSGEDSALCGDDYMVTGLRDSGRSVRNGKNADKAVLVAHKDVTGPPADFSRRESIGLDDPLAPDSSLLDPGYQRASVSAARFSAEINGPAASLSPV